ncbi:MAG: hypothetical protein R3E68_12490 [Burkholderiaceae bacterium]
MSEYTPSPRHGRAARVLATAVLGATLVAGTVLAAPTDADKALAALGRVATKDEVKAWDIDVRPDMTGLPPGKGTVDQGIDIWEEKCTSCHGIFGEVQRGLHTTGGRYDRRGHRSGQCRQPQGRLDLPAAHDADEGVRDHRALGLHQPGHALEHPRA